jgi:hypothetical protein
MCFTDGKYLFGTYPANVREGGEFYVCMFVGQEQRVNYEQINNSQTSNQFCYSFNRQTLRT